MIYYFTVQMKNTQQPLILLCLAFFFSTCSKSESDGISIKGFDITDYNGNLQGHSGPDDQDWGYLTNLSAKELALFNFGDDKKMDSAGVTTPAKVLVYPNPCSTQQIIRFYVADSTLMKMVIVDSRLKVVVQKEQIIKGAWMYNVDFSDKAKFPDRSSWRVYYSFSGKGHPNYATGYGDIKICSDLIDCF